MYEYYSLGTLKDNLHWRFTENRKGNDEFTPNLLFPTVREDSLNLTILLISAQLVNFYRWNPTNQKWCLYSGHDLGNGHLCKKKYAVLHVFVCLHIWGVFLHHFVSVGSHALVSMCSWVNWFSRAWQWCCERAHKLGSAVTQSINCLLCLWKGGQNLQNWCLPGEAWRANHLHHLPDDTRM